MNILREISNLSTYKPLKGLKRTIYDLSVVKGLSDDKAASAFESKHRNGQFSVVYGKLKYSLLDGVLDTPINKIPRGYLKKVRIWKRHIQIKLLIITGNKKAGISLAIRAINDADKNGEWGVMQSLSRELMIQFSTRDFDAIKYLKYKEKFDRSTNNLYQENVIESYYYDLVFCKSTKRSIAHLPERITELDKISTINDNYRFRHYYYTLKSLYYRTVSNESAFIQNNKEANIFFDSTADNLPYQVKYNWLIELSPTYIVNKEFAAASNCINKSISLPPRGDINWHKALLYRAYLGFYSNKPKIAYEAYKMAHSVTQKFDSKDITERWHIIRGYLELYAKIGRIDRPEQGKYFRLSSYLNINEKADNNSQKSNLIIIELLYLIFSKKYEKLLFKLDRIEPFISARFKSNDYKRTRYFLRMIKMVVKGNYHPVLTTAHAKRQYKNLIAAQSDLDAEVLNIAFVPYEILWGMVLDNLGSK